MPAQTFFESIAFAAADVLLIALPLAALMALALAPDMWWAAWPGRSALGVAVIALAFGRPALHAWSERLQAKG